jgi:cholesterol transport system auxiliary component
MRGALRVKIAKDSGSSANLGLVDCSSRPGSKKRNIVIARLREAIQVFSRPGMDCHALRPPRCARGFGSLSNDDAPFPSRISRYSSLVRVCSLFCCTLSAACSLPGSDGPDKIVTYTLGLPERFEPTEQRPQTACETLLVSTPLSAPGLATSAMAYVEEPNQVQYFAENRWIDTPARMLAPLLRQALGSSGLFHAVVISPAPVNAALRLETEVLNLRQKFEGDASAVELEMRASLFDLENRALLANETLRVEEPAPTADPHGGVVAANRAMAKLMDELIEGLKPALTGRECQAHSSPAGQIAPSSKPESL